MKAAMDNQREYLRDVLGSGKHLLCLINDVLVEAGKLQLQPIEAGDLERIFSPFEQIGFTGGRKNQGTGLGLSVSKGLVDLHGGRLWAESGGKGQGSSFHLLLPFLQG